MRMRLYRCFLTTLLIFVSGVVANAHSGPTLRRPISTSQPAWIIHIDVWNQADPQKIIDMVPEDIRPFVIFNISTSSSDSQSADGPAIYDSWMKVCAQNRVWTMIQCASGAHSRMPENDLKPYIRYFEDYPNFLGFNFAEQFWDFGVDGLPTFPERLQLFANLMPICHQYGGYLAVSFTQAYYSADMMPIAYMKRNEQMCDFLTNDPDHFLCFEKYTMKNSFYDIESNCLGAWLGGYAGQYGIRFDSSGWLPAGESTSNTTSQSDFVRAAGAIPIVEHVMLTGETMVDGPELIPTECSKEGSTTIVDGFTRRNWEWFPQFNNISMDLFRKILDGTIRIPSRQEVIDRTKICIVNDLPADAPSFGGYLTPRTLFDGLYRHDCDFGGTSSENHWLDNRWWMKRTGRYPAIPQSYYEVQGMTNIKKSQYDSRWSTIEAKVTEFNGLFPEEYTGDIYASRHENGWVIYNPYQFEDTKNEDGSRMLATSTKRAAGTIPFQYNSCEKITFDYAPYSLGIMKEYSDKLTLYLTNYQVSASGNNVTENEPIEDVITIYGATSEPTLTWSDRGQHRESSVKSEWKDGNLTIKVSHNGPLDLTINCIGQAADRLKVYKSAEIETPAAPDFYYGTLQYEAEFADYKDIAMCRANAFKDGMIGHCGQGFVEMGANKKATLRTIVNVSVAGSYNLSVRYKADKSGSVKVKANGQEHIYAMSETNGEWLEAVNTINLVQGENEMLIQNAQAVDVHIDCIKLMLNDATAIQRVQTFEAEGTEEWYDLQGRRLSAFKKGINIVKGRDGKVRKIIK